MSDEMKKNSLRKFKKGVSLNSAIIEGAVFTAGEIIPWHDEEGRDYDNDEYIDWVRIIKEYLIENHGKETEEYLLKVLPEDSFSNDGHKYVFWKHSEINGGNGFGDTFNSWGDLILNYGWKFPLNWWEIKSELDKISEGRKIILRPGDKHNNFGYHFSIIKKKSNIQEHIRKVLREETKKLSPLILRRYNCFEDFMNKLESGDSGVPTLQMDWYSYRNILVSYMRNHCGIGGSYDKEMNEKILDLYEDRFYRWYKNNIY